MVEYPWYIRYSEGLSALEVKISQMVALNTVYTSHGLESFIYKTALPLGHTNPGLVLHVQKQDAHIPPYPFIILRYVSKMLIYIILHINKSNSKMQ